MSAKSKRESITGTSAPEVNNGNSSATTRRVRATFSSNGRARRTVPMMAARFGNNMPSGSSTF